MNDALDREPIELVEIVLPKCANTYGTGLCTATGSGDGKCYNTRATCQDTANYRATPDGHLMPDVILATGDEVTSTTLTRNASLFLSARVRFAYVPDGIIYEQGGSAGLGTFLGVTSGNLVWRAGDGTVSSGANTGKVSVSATPYIGKTVDLLAEIDFTASSTSTVRLWLFDRVERTLTLLGEDDFTAGTNWAGTGAGGIGTIGGAEVVTGESSADWSGFVEAVKFYDSTTAPTTMPATYSQSVWLGRGVEGEPRNEKYILPCLQDLQTVGTRINIAGNDDNYEPLGRRATLDFACSDFTHSGITQDPYLTDRETDPRTLSTFWRKWLVRQKFGKVGALVRVYDGYAGQALADYKVRAYVLDRAESREDGIAFHCRDVLSRTEFRKAKVPPASTGKLIADVEIDATSLALIGDVTADYPAAGTLRVNNEIMTYTARAYATDRTTFTGLVRGTDGSDASAHDAEDLVQICRRYTRGEAADVLTRLICDDAGVPAQFIDAAGFAEQQDLYLQPFQLTTLITEPTGVSELIGKLSEECGFYCWWDEREQVIRIKAITGIVPNTQDATWTYEGNIIKGSMKEQERPKERLNVVEFYFNPIDFTGDLRKPANFHNGLSVVNGEASADDQYGDYVQSREIFSLWLTTEGEASQTATRLATRYADIPRYLEFLVDAKDRDLWVGDVIVLSHPLIVDDDGRREERRWLMVEAEEIDPGHIVRYHCVDITLDGFVYLITENSSPDYTAALFATGQAFITNDSGNFSDGSAGTRIS